MAENGRKKKRCRRRSTALLLLLSGLLLLGGCKAPGAKEPGKAAEAVTGDFVPAGPENGATTGTGGSAADDGPVPESLPGSGAPDSGTETEGSEGSASAIRNGDKGYPFYKDGLKIEIDAPAAEIIAALGEPVSYFEAAACAIGDLDKVYTYNGFQVYTYQVEGVDYISSVTLTDNTNTTARGISIGSSRAEVKLSYGNPTEEDSVQFVYESGGMSLIFRFEGERVSRISYVTGKL